jgi:UDP-N-acetyl-D-mannosaminuronic acid dehydrogenase
VGGHCIAVDPWFVVDGAPELTPLIRAARAVNDGKPLVIAQDIIARAAKFKQPVVACYGISYKPGVQDIRESPAIVIVETLLAANIKVVVCDPVVAALPPALAQNPLVTHEPVGSAHETADIVAFLVGHPEFKKLRASDFATKVIVDPIGWTRVINGPNETRS